MKTNITTKILPVMDFAKTALLPAHLISCEDTSDKSDPPLNEWEDQDDLGSRGNFYQRS
ncbi:MAG: hypothetical protein OXM55_06670 [Bdellovibrionales bacterium]|nr:hypothetical protein [Bdellovibrionales bacterium]